jgi:DNA (cytosine-5)-methyltransferase 1
VQTTTSGRRPAGSFTFVDLFAGIGGFRFALEGLSGKCVFSVELDRFARSSYAANFEIPEGKDIRDVEQLPAHDFLAAGFPCQPFSIAGVSKKLSLGREHGFLDKTQGTLFFHLAELIGKSQPKIVILENVKNLTSHDGGRTFAVITRTLDELGYNVSHQVIDAQRWVPQHRERVFIVGMRRETYGDRTFIFPAVPAEGGPTLGSILEHKPDRKYTLSPHLWSYLQAYAAKHKRLGNGFGFGLVGPDDIARTLSARYHKDGSEILIKSGSRRPPRRLTPRECARLMGFPESYEITVSDTQAYRQFGNAVVVPVVTHVARAVLEQMKSPKRVLAAAS